MELHILQDIIRLDSENRLLVTQGMPAHPRIFERAQSRRTTIQYGGDKYTIKQEMLAGKELKYSLTVFKSSGGVTSATDLGIEFVQSLLLGGQDAL